MDNSSNMLQLCRLCLVKDDVNIPIFEEQGDIRQIFLKISSCLPVKVSQDDRLPKKICDGCSYKLDMLYEFWNSSANAEKQLLTWLGEAGMTSQMTDGTISAVAQQIKPADALVKQETIDPPDINHSDDDEDDDKTYMFNKQEEKVSKNNIDEPPPKRQRRTAAVKAAIAMDQNSDDDDDSGEPMTKMEDDSDDSDNDDHEPAFVDVPSTSADDQPGPSGMGKDGVDAPLHTEPELITPDYPELNVPDSPDLITAVMIKTDDDDDNSNEESVVEIIDEESNTLTASSSVAVSSPEENVPTTESDPLAEDPEDVITIEDEEDVVEPPKNTNTEVPVNTPRIRVATNLVAELPSQIAAPQPSFLDPFMPNPQQYFCNGCNVLFSGREEFLSHVFNKTDYPTCRVQYNNLRLNPDIVRESQNSNVLQTQNLFSPYQPQTGPFFLLTDNQVALLGANFFVNSMNPQPPPPPHFIPPQLNINENGNAANNSRSVLKKRYLSVPKESEREINNPSSPVNNEPKKCSSDKLNKHKQSLKSIRKSNKIKGKTSDLATLENKEKKIRVTVTNINPMDQNNIESNNIQVPKITNVMSLQSNSKVTNSNKLDTDDIENALPMSFIVKDILKENDIIDLG